MRSAPISAAPTTACTHGGWRAVVPGAAKRLRRTCKCGRIAETPGHTPLRVTSPNAFASRWLVPRLPQWREIHPETPLEITGPTGCST